MNRLFKMAWRNIWRNRRRSLITIASIFFAVFFALFMRSMQLGSYGHMIKQTIEKYSGYLQIQNPEYFDEPSLDNSMEYSAALIEKLNNTEGVKIAVPRIESFALASTGHQSKGIMVSGIDPEKEKLASNPEFMLVNYRLSPEIVKTIIAETDLAEKQQDFLKLFENSVYHNIDRLALDIALKPEQFEPYKEIFEKHTKVDASYLTEKDDGVLVSNRLSKFLRVDVGDTIILIGSGYQGASAAGLFPVRGIVKVPSPDLDNKLVFMTLGKAQEFLDMADRITAIAMNLQNTKEMFEIQERLSQSLNADAYVVKNWEEMNPVLKQQIEGDDKSGQMFVGILYFIIFFGIIGTVMMMIAERKREFGVLVAIGMRKRKLALVVLIEMFFMGLVGTVSGMIAVIPLIITLYINPITMTGEIAKMYEDMGFEAVMPTAPIDHYFTWQGLIVLLMVILACYIPLKRIRKMKVMNALRA